MIKLIKGLYIFICGLIMGLVIIYLGVTHGNVSLAALAFLFILIGIIGNEIVHKMDIALELFAMKNKKDEK